MFSFNVNLSGIIELLSRNLYSSPNVYIRELLQNSVDAIRARQEVDKTFKPHISVEIYDVEPFIEKDGQLFISDELTSLIIEDNGIGLTEDELHQYLSTIGQSSKSKRESHIHNDLLGQFGIGFLSAFIVSDEIVLYTKSFKTPDKVIEWRGTSDGKYSVTLSDINMDVGTKVFLKAKPDMEHFLATENVSKLIKSFGNFLQFPVHILHEGNETQINEIVAPWELTDRNEILEYGFNEFDIHFFDQFKVESKKLGIAGTIYILPYSPKMSEIKQNAKIYLKRMYLSESKAQLFPDWAFFVKAILNVEFLEPTASREDFIENEKLAEVKTFLSQALIEYLKKLSKSDTKKFQHLIDLHSLSLKALAVKDDEIYKLFINLFEFETTHGWMTIPQFIEHFGMLQYTNTVDEFRQLASIANAQKIGLMNGGYVYDRELLSHYVIKNADVVIKTLEPSSISNHFEELSKDEFIGSTTLIDLANEILKPFQCRAVVKHFNPNDVMAIYNISESQLFRKSVDDIRDSSEDENLSGILGGLFGQNESTYEDLSVLCFNFSNKLVQNLAKLSDGALMKHTIEIIYVQAVLMARRPLNADEMKLLNSGIGSLLIHALK